MSTKILKQNKQDILIKQDPSKQLKKPKRPKPNRRKDRKKRKKNNTMLENLDLFND